MNSNHPKSGYLYIGNYQNSPSSTELKHSKGQGLVERLFKIIIVGDPAVGKTSFVQRFTRGTFKANYKSTVGVDFSLKILKLTEKEVIKLQLWDIAGQERFTWMTRVYYKNANAAIVMFDINRRSTFLNSIKWKKEVDTKCSLLDGSEVPCLLLANKCDLLRRVDQIEIDQLCRQHNFIGWTEISARDDLMVTESMRFLIDIMKQHTIDGKQSEKEAVAINLSKMSLATKPAPSSKCSC